MGKWKQNQRREDPDAAWKAIVAEMLPQAQPLCDALVASWNGSIPADYGILIHRSVTLPLVRAKYGTEYNSTVSIANQQLTERLEKPIRQIVDKAQRDAEKAAEALVDTKRPVVRVGISSSKERIGSFAVLSMPSHRKHEYDQVLVCIDCGYVPGDGEEQDNGWYCDYAEPNEAEKAMPVYQELVAKVEADRAYEQSRKKLMDDRRQADLDVIRDQGREPTFWEDMTAGTSDN